MKVIEIETDVFAEIWALRREAEECESDILRRVLEEYRAVDFKNREVEEMYLTDSRNSSSLYAPSKVRWVDDVLTALENLKGSAHLSAIYEEVRRLREQSGRSTPKSLEATVRKELEYNSPDSDVFRGRALFRMIEKGSGIWRLH